MKSQINPYLAAPDPGALLFLASVGPIGAEKAATAATGSGGPELAAPEAPRAGC
jgi:hypothetical protein